MVAWKPHGGVSTSRDAQQLRATMRSTHDRSSVLTSHLSMDPEGSTYQNPQSFDSTITPNSKCCAILDGAGWTTGSARCHVGST